MAMLGREWANKTKQSITCNVSPNLFLYCAKCRLRLKNLPKTSTVPGFSFVLPIQAAGDVI